MSAAVFYLFIYSLRNGGSLTAGLGGEGTCGGGMEGVGEKFQSAPRVHTAFVSHGLVIKVCFEAVKHGFVPMVMVDHLHLHI